MGMTINKCLEKLAHERQCFIDECYQNDGELEAYDMAMSTMRKYQRIEQIVSDFKEYQKGISCGFGGEVYMQMVSEVVEDGNVK